MWGRLSAAIIAKADRLLQRRPHGMKMPAR